VLKNLGAKPVDDIRECTHLISLKLARTEKFLCGIAYCDYILNENWVKDSQHKARLLGK
jgi:hypothetical protein